MNGLPATIVIGHLMAGPVPIPGRPVPTATPPTRRRWLTLRLLVPRAVRLTTVATVFALAGLGSTGV
jgi:hypothetical protein